MKWIIELKNKILERKAAEKEDAGENKILEFLKSLKFQWVKTTEKIGNSRVVTFINEKWSIGVDYYDLFLVYRELNLGIINKHVSEYYNLIPKLEEYNKNFSYLNQELERIRIKKINYDTSNMVEEHIKLDLEIIEMKQRKGSIETWFSNMGYKRKNVITKLDSDCKNLFVIEYIKSSPRVVIIYVSLVLINILTSILNFKEYGLIGGLLWLGVLSKGYYELVYSIGLRAIRTYVGENNELKNAIKNDYKNAFKEITSYGKEKKIEEPEMPSREELKMPSREELRQKEREYNPVQQPKEKELYNPNKNEWQEIFEQFFKNHNFKVPEFEKLETTEVHIFNIPTISIADFSGKQEQIENFIGKRIYKINKEYEGIGKIGIEFETVELPRIISYNEVPQPKKKNEIMLGRGIKSWISWDISTSPHMLVVGSTGGGKSVTMNFIISQVVKKRWLSYFVDFKGGIEFSIYKNNGYTVITEREDFIQFTKGLYGEVEYRSKLLSEYRVKNLDDINKKLKADNKAILPRTMVFLDEYADVNSVKDEFSDIVNSNIGRVLAKGRAVGVHLILGTQRPDAKTIGEGAFRDNIACRLIGKMNSDSAYAMSFGTTTLTKEDKIYTNKMPDDDRSKGMFIVQGTGTINDKEIIRVPFMEDEEFEDMVLNEWEDNEYADYKLHSLEDNEAEEYEEHPVSKVDIEKLKKFKGKYAKDNVVEIQEEYDTHSADFDINDFIDL